MYCMQNVCIALSAVSCLAALLQSPAAHPQLFLVFNIAAVAAAAGSTLGALGSTVAVEKDWVSALHRAQPLELGHVNASEP